MCVTDCGAQLYGDPDTLNCEKCHSNCFSCVGPLETDCENCKIFSTGNCEFCEPLCKECETFSDHCTVCYEDFYLKKYGFNTCVEDCGEHFYV